MKYCFTLFFLCICIILSGCSVNEEVDIWPLVYYEHNKEKKKLGLICSLLFIPIMILPNKQVMLFDHFLLESFAKIKFIWILCSSGHLSIITHNHMIRKYGLCHFITIVIIRDQSLAKETLTGFFSHFSLLAELMQKMERVKLIFI